MNMNVIGSICTNCVPGILGNRSEFATLLKKEVHKVCVILCLLHWHALTMKTCPKDLQDVLSSCVKIVNSIRGHSLNLQLFQTFCESIDSSLSYRGREVRWLFRLSMHI